LARALLYSGSTSEARTRISGGHTRKLIRVAEGAHAQSKRLEVLSNNLANVDTAGFKRDLAIFQSRLAEATLRGMDEPGSGSMNDLGGGVAFRQTKTDFSPGALKKTGVPSDMAIDGDGFFVVQKGDKSFLTRAGNFQFDGQGQLVNQDGYPVLNDAGTPIVIEPDGGPWQLTADGGVAQNGTITYLALVRPQSLGDLAKAGENLFAPLAPTVPVDPADRRVAGGVLEGSGVKPTLEMMELIESSRAFEANINMIRNHDQMLGSLVGRVLKE